jgi:ATP-binding cassette subfamily B protein/ATP-binding cassette subfamily C protein
VKSLKILPNIYLLKVSVSALLRIDRFQQYILPVLAILAIILFSELCATLLKRYTSDEKPRLDFQIKQWFIEKNDVIDYYTLSTKEYYEIKEKAMEAYGRDCIEENIHHIFSMVSNGILLCSLLYTLYSLGITLLLPLAGTVIVRIISEYYDRKAEYIRTSEMTGVNRKNKYLHVIGETIQYAKDIRIFNLQGSFAGKLRDTSNEKIALWKNYFKTFRKSAFLYVIADTILQLVIYLVLTYRALVTKSIDISDFVFFFAAYQQIQGTVGDLALHNLDIISNARFLGDFITYWFYQGTLNSGGMDIDAVSGVGSLTIEFKDVCFRYPNTDFDAASHINITLKSGESFLVVGKNGAGKSTFVKLLCRLYAPTSGTVLLNGVDIQRFSLNSYMRILSVLFQDYKTLNISIKDNITSMDEEVESACFSDAAQNADILDKIRTLPCQENTSYGKSFDEAGVEFSGGEAQKMMIAKTLCKDAPVQIYDEPAAGLDAVAEYHVFNSIQKVCADKILIYITHRLSTGVNSDNILVFSEGGIVEKGNHKELMQTNGIYATLFGLQATLYAEDVL